MEFQNTDEFLSKVKRIIISENQIKSAVKKAGEMINSSYQGTPILLVSILKGSFIFLSDLCREVKVPCEVGFGCQKLLRRYTFFRRS